MTSAECKTAFGSSSFAQPAGCHFCAKSLSVRVCHASCAIRRTKAGDNSCSFRMAPDGISISKGPRYFHPIRFADITAALIGPRTACHDLTEPGAARGYMRRNCAIEKDLLCIDCNGCCCCSSSARSAVHTSCAQRTMGAIAATCAGSSLTSRNAVRDLRTATGVITLTDNLCKRRRSTSEAPMTSEACAAAGTSPVRARH